MDIPAVLTGRTKDIPTIVLAHQPRAAAKAIVWDDVRLVLSGHTHGGQFFPWMMIINFIWSILFLLVSISLCQMCTCM